MDDTSLKQNAISCVGSQGVPISGSIVQLGSHEVVFEVFSPAAVLRASEVLREFKIQLRDHVAYSGRAVVKNVVQSELKLVCSVAVSDPWSLRFSAEDLGKGRLRTLFQEHLREWQNYRLIRPEYKLQIADMESFLAELRLWLEQVELGIRNGSNNGSSHEDEVAEELAASILPCIDALFEKFEGIAQSIDPAATPLHRAYMQRQLHPLLLCAPFPHRTFTKPLGYAGDYEMVNMIARNRPEGASLYAKIINLCFVRQPPATAHRNRLDYLTRRLVEETARMASRREPARILSVACGPAVEIQNFLRNHDLSDWADLTLLDFNEETLKHVTGAIDDIKLKRSRRTPVRIINRSVHQLIKDAMRGGARTTTQHYDFIYCAGLFDYLTDAVCQQLMTLFHDWLAPDGLLLATNVEPSSNPVRTGTEHLLDWHLIARTASQLHALRPSQAAPEDFLVQSDMTGVNLFMEVRKSRDG